MKIVIAGGGYNGTTIAKYFVSEKNSDITIVDCDEKVINRITSSMPLGGVVGSATDTRVLESAGIKDADVFISTCPSDETNLFSCSMVTDIYKIKTKIAKVASDRYFADRKMHNYLHSRRNNSTNIDHLIVPNIRIISNITHRMMYCNSSILDADTIDSSSIKTISVQCLKESDLIGKSFRAIKQELSDDVALIGIKRAGEFLLDAEDIEIREDDVIKLALNEQNIVDNIEYISFQNSKEEVLEQNKPNVTIIGSDNLAVSFAKELQRYDVGKVDIIVSGLAKSRKLSHELHGYGVNVINVNLENKENIQQLQLKPDDYCIVSAGKQEDSVIICFLLKQYGIKNVFSYMDSKFYYDILKNNNIHHVFSPETFIVSEIIPFVRSCVVYNAMVIEQDYELLYAEIAGGCDYDGRSISYVNSEKVKILGIVQNNNLVTVSDDYTLSDKTRILILFHKDELESVEQGLNAFYS